MQNSYKAIVSSLLLGACAGMSVADDGPNLVPNPGFEEELTDWVSFGSAFSNNELTRDFSLFALKMYGCFCSPFNAAGAYSASGIPVTPGEVHRLTVWVQNPSWDTIYGSQNWCGIKVDFQDEFGVLVGLAEQRVLNGADPMMPQDEWIQGDILVDPPPGSATATIVPVFLQSVAADAGACWIDDVGFATADRDYNEPIINGGFNNGVDWTFSTYQIFNGWTEQYGSVFFDDWNYQSAPFSAGLYGAFIDTDGDKECDAPGNSGLHQWIPDVSEGREVVLQSSCMTPAIDSIIGTTNHVIQKIEFFGSDKSTPLDTVEGTVLSGDDPNAENDTWYTVKLTGTAPAGTESIRIVQQFVQPDCETGSARVDDVSVTLDGDPPSTDCPGDFNDDGDVNGADFGALLAAWGPCPDCPEDVTGDGVVTGADVGLILSYWGPCPEDYNCDVPHDGPGCNDAICRDIVCDLDPVCCTTNWDQVCANLAIANCP